MLFSKLIFCFRKLSDVLYAPQCIELMEHSMREVCLDEETGSLDFARGAMGGGMSKSGELKRFLSALEKAAQNKKDSMFQEFEMDEIAQKIGVMQNFREMHLLQEDATFC